MEVRWRLFARDVLSLLADDAGEFLFGRPPRPVRGLRLLGVVVHREGGGGTFAPDSRRPEEEEAGTEGVTGNGEKRGKTGGGDESSGDGSLVEGEFGVLGIGECSIQHQVYVVYTNLRRLGWVGGMLLSVGERVDRTYPTQKSLHRQQRECVALLSWRAAKNLSQVGETMTENSKPFFKNLNPKLRSARTTSTTACPACLLSAKHTPGSPDRRCVRCLHTNISIFHVKLASWHQTIRILVMPYSGYLHIPTDLFTGRVSHQMPVLPRTMTHTTPFVYRVRTEDNTVPWCSPAGGRTMAYYVG